jgi:hypothetical protein
MIKNMRCELINYTDDVTNQQVGTHANTALHVKWQG